MKSTEQAAQDNGRVICEHLRSLAHYDIVPDAVDFEDFLLFTEPHAPDLGELMIRSLSTGTVRARQKSKVDILRCMKMFMTRMTHPVDGTGLERMLLETWNTANVREETGLPEMPLNIRSNRGVKSGYLTTDHLTDNMWRGFAAARIIEENTGDKLPDSAFTADSLIGFCEVFGDHPDIASVITVGIDRVTLDPKTIQFVLAGSQHATSLRGGVL